MASQEEILDFILKNGWANLKMLKKHFGINSRGSSYLPQRLRALEKKKLIVTFRFGRIVSYFPSPNVLEQYKMSEKERREIRKKAREEGFIKETRGRKPTINERNIIKIMKIIREKKIINYWQLRNELGWDHKTLIKYIKYMLRNGMIFEYKFGKNIVFTKSLL